MKNTVRHTPAMELLAPAGSFAAFEAALEEGADAIYLGAPKLNARALSRDFTYEEIDSLVRTAHAEGIKLYIAMNSLVKEDELDLAVKGLAMFEKIGPDALIIQDLGLYHLARRYFSGLNLHASTLMSVHNSLAVDRFTELGFKRVVLPRELTMEEIQEIHKQTGAELEIFVHGAMCFSYSGLCLFSSMFGGKSSLRGQCVQPCRRRYNWQKKKAFVKKGKLTEKEGGYLFSMHDLSGIELLAKLQAAGVSSLKIEGRLKSAEYVRKVVRAYRLMLDNLNNQRVAKAVVKEAQRYLDEAMGRKRSQGFFLASKPREAVTPTLSGNIGVPVGRVQKLEEKSVGRGGRQTVLSIELIRDVVVGDRLRLHDEKTGERAAFTLRILKLGQRSVKQAKAGQKVQAVLKEKILKNRKGAIKGSLFKVDVGSGKNEEPRAKSRLMGKKKIPFLSDEGKVKRILEDWQGVQPQLRSRHGKGKKLPVWFWVESLRDRQYKLPLVPAKYIVPISRENLELLADAPAKAYNQDENLVWSLPPIIHQDRLTWYQEKVQFLIKKGFTAFQLGHLSQTGFFSDQVTVDGGIELYANYTCNILNSSTLNLFLNDNFKGMQFSLETDGENLQAAARHFSSINGSANGTQKTLIGMYVYGHPPLFTARLDDNRYQYGKRFVSPRGEVFALDRNEDLTRARSMVAFSLMDVRQDLAQCGIDYLVVDFTGTNMKKNLAEFSSLFRGNRTSSAVMSGNFSTGLL